MRTLLLLSATLILPIAAPNAHAQPTRTGIIFIVNGSGDNTSITDNIGPVLHHRCVPLAVHTLRWCPTGTPAFDHLGYEAQMESAAKLADRIATYRALYPKEKIYVVAYSAGTHVALAAARKLPADSVDRIVLMAPNVSRYHDLRPALRASRGGIDHFYSGEDQVASIFVDSLGNGDRLPGLGAGEVGFSPPPPGCPDAHLYQKLRQHRWNPHWRTWGHHGGHAGFTRETFLDAVLLPTLLADGGPR